MRPRRLALALAAAVALLAGTAAEQRAAARADVDGWRGVRWGTPVAEVIAAHDGAFVVQQTKIEINGCYVQYAIPLELFGERWHAWLCEDREAPVVVAVNVESADATSARAAELLDGMTNAYGVAHRAWLNCVNARGANTSQYRWYFPSTTVTLLDRDADRGWLVMRYEAASDRPEFGPGRCWTPPVDSGGQAPGAGGTVQPAEIPGTTGSDESAGAAGSD